MIASLRERVASGTRPERRRCRHRGRARRHHAHALVGRSGRRPLRDRVPQRVYEVDEVGSAAPRSSSSAPTTRAPRSARRGRAGRRSIPPWPRPWRWSAEASDAFNAQDRARLRALFADDLVVEDHRRTGMGRIEGGDAYVDSLAVLWDLAAATRVELGWFWPRVRPAWRALHGPPHRRRRRRRRLRERLPHADPPRARSPDAHRAVRARAARRGAGALRGAAAELNRRLDGREILVVPAPALVEGYAVLTRLPPPHRLSPDDARHLIEANFIAGARVAALDSAEYVALVRRAPDKGITGGRTSDAMSPAARSRDVRRACSRSTSGTSRRWQSPGSTSSYRSEPAGRQLRRWSTRS